MGAILLAVALGCPVGAAHPDAGVEAARRALAASPERPGLQLAFAEQLLRAGDPDGAERCADRVIERWPGAVRARLLLARIALGRDEQTRARALLQPIAASGPRVAAAEARRLLGAAGTPADAPGRWGGAVAVGGYHDSRAAALDPSRSAPEGEPLPEVDDPAAWRLALSGHGAWGRVDPEGTLRARLGVDRTLHLAEVGDPGRLDHTSLWLDGHREHRLGAHRLGYGAELRGTLSGRLGAPHHLGLGLVGWWRRSGASGGPWVRARAFGFRFGEAAERDPYELWTEVALGGTWTRGLFAVDGRVGGQWVGPGERAYVGVAADARPGISGRHGGLYLLGGVGWRRADAGDALSPRLGVGGRLALGDSSAVAVDGIWQQARRTDTEAPSIDRIVVGTTLEARF